MRTNKITLRWTILSPADDLSTVRMRQSQSLPNILILYLMFYLLCITLDVCVIVLFYLLYITLDVYVIVLYYVLYITLDVYVIVLYYVLYITLDIYVISLYIHCTLHVLVIFSIMP